MGEFPKPGPEHQKLKRLTGAWTAHIRWWEVPGGKPHESNGQFQARMDLGGYFLCREMNFGMQGFQGRGVVGYDPFKRQYSGIWLDSEGPLLYPTIGNFDEQGAFCEMSEGPGPDGAIVRTRMKTEMPDPNQMLFRMYRIADDGSESIALEIEHQRRKFG